MTQISPSKEAITNTSYSLDFDCCVQLPETKQIIINVLEKVFDNVKDCWVDTMKKYRLEELTYKREKYSSYSPNAVLTSITVRGFKKDETLKYRTKNISYRYITKEVLEQIPDEYHDTARAEFAETMKKMHNELTEITNNGIQIKVQE